jgi:hypothetical protein
LGGTNPFVASAASAIAGRPYGHSRRSNKAHASTADSARGYGTPQAGQPLKVVRVENLDGLVIDAYLRRPMDASGDCGPRSPGSLGVNRRVGSCSAPFHQRTAPVSACANGSKRPSRGSRRPPDRTPDRREPDSKIGSALGLSPSRLQPIIARGCRSAVTKKPFSKLNGRRL